MKKIMHIEGMMCGHCEAAVKKALEALPQVDEAVVSHEAGTAELTLNAEIAEDSRRQGLYGDICGIIYDFLYTEYTFYLKHPKNTAILNYNYHNEEGTKVNEKEWNVNAGLCTSGGIWNRMFFERSV